MKGKTKDRFAFKKYDSVVGKEVWYKQMLFTDDGEVELSEENLSKLNKEQLIDIISQLCEDVRRKESSLQHWIDGYNIFCK